ncbi:alpha/beta hydrolase [Neiella sp. HB171785]|uniref:Alpha/beta hydrolase n=1 Tax=Neiella litorisoli TaxID=2771431 RepID=A0A8J6UL39_9GAMM|nr:alpha/beta hydrolase [Neiella litorisoli]MBD1388245.1 alpha/beta hydrolase [Neiella litorisoli]
MTCSAKLLAAVLLCSMSVAHSQELTSPAEPSLDTPATTGNKTQTVSTSADNPVANIDDKPAKPTKPAKSKPEPLVLPEPEVQQGALLANTFTLGDVSIHYRTVGTGAPLLLVHGFLDSGELWQPYLDRLSNHFQVIVPDLRGHGLSTNPSEMFSYREAAADLSALMAHLNIAKFDAVGYGEGALTLTRMAIEQPKRIGKLVLIGSGSYLAESAREQQRKAKGFNHFSKAFQSKLVALHPGGQPQVDALLAQYRALAADYQQPNFSPPQLQKIIADTLMINGQHDKYFPLEPVLDQHRHLKQSSLWLIPDRNHDLVFYGAPPSLENEFMRILLAHLKKE